MANSFTNSHVSVSMERLWKEFLLGTESFDKGIAQIIPGNHHQVSLDRFFADGTDEARTSTFAAATKGDLIKDEKQIILDDRQLTFQLNVTDFDDDRPWLWSNGPRAMPELSPRIQEAIISEAGKRFRKLIENRLWNGGGAITGWVADIAAADTRGNTVVVPAAGAITGTNVVTIFSDMLDAMPPDVRDNAQRTSALKFVTTSAVRQTYGNTLTGNQFKDNDTSARPIYRYQDIEVVSSTAIPANTVYLLVAGPADEAALKAAVWMDSDRFNIQWGKNHPLDDEIGIRLVYEMGTQTKINGEIVTYLPV